MIQSGSCAAFMKSTLSGCCPVSSRFIVLPYSHLKVKHLRSSSLKCCIQKGTKLEIGNFQTSRIKEDPGDMSSPTSHSGWTGGSMGSAQLWLSQPDPAFSTEGITTSLSLLMGGASQSLHLSWSLEIEIIFEKSVKQGGRKKWTCIFLFSFFL